MAIDESALDRFREQLLAAMRVEMLEATRASEARLEERLGARLEERLGARLEERLDGRLARIEASVVETRRHVLETRRHMDVVAEGLRSDISLVAEGVVTLTERLSSEMREGFETLDRRVMRLEARLLSDGRG